MRKLPISALKDRHLWPIPPILLSFICLFAQGFRKFSAFSTKYAVLTCQIKRDCFNRFSCRKPPERPFCLSFGLFSGQLCILHKKEALYLVKASDGLPLFSLFSPFFRYFFYSEKYRPGMDKKRPLCENTEAVFPISVSRSEQLCRRSFSPSGPPGPFSPARCR